MNDNWLVVILAMIFIGGCVGDNYVDAYRDVEFKKLETQRTSNIIKAQSEIIKKGLK